MKELFDEQFNVLMDNILFYSLGSKRGNRAYNIDYILTVLSSQYTYAVQRTYYE
ncbi:hypothetical protein vBEcoMphAPEC6_00515 [Escherichia phage ph0011]|nr:hypothetical protein vBEcoMphAPEC6_00515 [Escherichia phage ph0011]